MTTDGDISPFDSFEQEVNDLTKNVVNIISIGSILDKSKSSSLAGVLGFTIGGLLYMAFNTGLALAFPVIGGVIGIFLFRGITQIKIERTTAEYDTVRSSITSKINSLPKDAPDYVKSELYSQLLRIDRAYEEAINRIFPNNSSTSSSVSAVLAEDSEMLITDESNESDSGI